MTNKDHNGSTRVANPRKSLDTSIFMSSSCQEVKNDIPRYSGHAFTGRKCTDA